MENKIKAEYFILTVMRMFGRLETEICKCYLTEGGKFLIVKEGKATRYKQITAEEFQRFSKAFNAYTNGLPIDEFEHAVQE